MMLVISGHTSPAPPLIARPVPTKVAAASSPGWLATPLHPWTSPHAPEKMSPTCDASQPSARALRRPQRENRPQQSRAER